MTAVRLHEPGGAGGLRVEEVDTPAPGPGEALVRVHAAALTRDELEWPVDRLPAIPSYELSGVVAELGRATNGVVVGEKSSRSHRSIATARLPTTPSSRRSSWPRSPRRSTTSRAPPFLCRRSAPGRGSSSTVAWRRGSVC